MAAQYSFAQNPDAKRTNHWYFGAGAGLDFSNGNPMPDTNSVIGTLERTATISDTSGNLLAYYGCGNITKEFCVFNRFHQPMPNGCNLIPGKATPRDGGVFIPKPGSNNILYLFTIDGWENQFQRGLRWHEIDMSADNGNGDVISKNNILPTSNPDYPVFSEQLAATRHSNGCDYWVVGHERSSANFLAYKITQDGVDSIPVVSNIGQDYGITQQYYNLNGGYHIGFNPQGNKAAVVVYWSYPITKLPEQIQLINFNNNTGIFFHVIDIPIDTSVTGPYFSSDGTKLYLETGYSGPYSRFYQFDLSSGIDSVIQKSAMLIFTSPVNIASDGQIGLDGNLYLSTEWDYLSSKPNPNFLSVIANPNARGVACDIRYGAQTLGPRRSQQGVPNFVSNFTNPNGPKEICEPNYLTENQSSPFTVYPNPADKVLSIGFEAGLYCEVTIFDLLGLEKYTIENTSKNEISIDTSSLLSGIYFLKIKNKKYNIIYPIIINH